MSLHYLSDELILEVAKHLESIYDDNRHLQSLVSCSRRLNNIVSPLLYRKFTQVWNKLAALPNLLRLVIGKPRIGAEIKILVLKELDDSRRSDRLDMSGYSPQDLERCRAVMDSLVGVPIDKSKWMAALEKGNWDAVVSLLLFFLPLLEEIEIESGGLSSSTYLHQVTQHMTLQHNVENPSHSLKHLKNFSNNYWDTRYGMGIHSILQFCALPSVNTVSAQSLAQEDHYTPYPYPVERYRVQNLSLENSCLGGNTLRDLLRRFICLRNFYYSHGGAIVGMADFLPQKVGEGIAHLYDSLEELTLLGIEYDEAYGDEPRLSLGCLAEFKKLRHIDTEGEIMFGPKSELVKPELTNILPPSLEVLQIHDCEDYIYAQLRDLIVHGKQRFPFLKKVSIDIPKARAGNLYGIGSDGLHKREEEVKQNIAIWTAHPNVPDIEKYIKNATEELERIQSNKPSDTEWEQWRIRQGIEVELINEYNKVGVALRFNLIDDYE